MRGRGTKTGSTAVAPMSFGRMENSIRFAVTTPGSRILESHPTPKRSRHLAAADGSSMTISPYTWLLLAGVFISFLFWKQRARQDGRLVFIYGAALVGAFFGAKLVYLFAEGWLHFGAPDMWFQLAAGKSILGALLGGYVFVELAKRHVGYASATGDDFALIAPISIGLGRVGCLLHGCCLGAVCSPRWYALRDTDGVPR